MDLPRLCVERFNYMMMQDVDLCTADGHIGPLATAKRETRETLVAT